MTPIKYLADLPKPLAHIAAGFIAMDPVEPAILEAKPEEMINLKAEEDVVFQLIIDKEWFKWYLVAVGEITRTRQSEYIIHDPFDIKRSLLVFAEVDDAWIRSKRAELGDKTISDPRMARVWTGEDFGLEEINSLLEQQP